MAARTAIYGIRNCDTMKKAFAWLDAQGVAYEFHDYKKAGVPVARLQAWSTKLGWEVLCNTRGPTWRKIPESQRGNLNASRALKLLEANPSAIKRPVLESGAQVLAGFDPATWARILKVKA
jgi:Spx/MgsR family transcriptional regulator